MYFRVLYMSTLIISDKFYQIENNYSYITWNGPNYFTPRAYNNFLIDLQFESINDGLNKNLLYYIKEQLFNIHFLNEYRKNIIIIYGNNHEFEYEVPYDENVYDSKMIDYNFCLIDLIKNFFDKYDYQNIEPTNANEIISLASDPFYIYFKFYATNNAYFIFNYNKAYNKHTILPLAVINEEDMELVAFEYKFRKSNVLILPPYKFEYTDNVFKFIEDIFYMYNTIYSLTNTIASMKTKYKNDDFLLTHFNELNNLILNKDYISTILICARIVDYFLSIIIQGSEKFQTLGKKIKNFSKNNFGENIYPDETLCDLLKNFNTIRNWAAHPDKYFGKQIKFCHAKDAVDILCFFLIYIQMYPKLHDIRKNIQELEVKGDDT